MLFATATRHVVPELMDSPAVDPRAHMQALAGLARINALSRTAPRMLAPIRRLAHRQNLRQLSLLDVACGGGDVPITLAASLHGLAITVDLTLFDRSLTALARAQSKARNRGLTATSIPGSAPQLPDRPFDLITSSLFLHHLSRPEVIALLTQMRRRTARMILISDLRRSTAGLATAWLGCRLLSRSPIVHYDGPASVRAAWTIPELAQMAAEAGLDGVQIRPTFPCRFLLLWQPPEGRP